MTGPEQVSVNVTDLQVFRDFIEASGIKPEPGGAFWNLVHAIPEPEWEPTDDMRDKVRAVLPVVRRIMQASEPYHDSSPDILDDILRAMHREGLP